MKEHLKQKKFNKLTLFSDSSDHKIKVKITLYGWYHQLKIRNNLSEFLGSLQFPPSKNNFSWIYKGKLAAIK